jgi:tetratricopeptide (TPR) repeat protein
MSNSNTNELLKSLETLYTKANYQEAIDLLLKNKESFDPALFHYNLGSIYLKNKNLPIARYHLEKATHLGFTSSEVLNNLKVTEHGLNLTSVETTGSWSTDYFYQALFLPQTYVIIYALFVVSLLLFVKKLKKLSWMYFTSFALLLLSPAAIKSLLSDNLQQVVVLKTSHCKEGPSGIFEDNHELPAGLKIIVTKPKDGWYFIKYPSHLSGWVKKDDLGII